MTIGLRSSCASSPSTTSRSRPARPSPDVGAADTDRAAPPRSGRDRARRGLRQEQDLVGIHHGRPVHDERAREHRFELDRRCRTRDTAEAVRGRLVGTSPAPDESARRARAPSPRPAPARPRADRAAACSVDRHRRDGVGELGRESAVGDGVGEIADVSHDHVRAVLVDEGALDESSDVRLDASARPRRGWRRRASRPAAPPASATCAGERARRQTRSVERDVRSAPSAREVQRTCDPRGTGTDLSLKTEHAYVGGERAPNERRSRARQERHLEIPAVRGIGIAGAGGVPRAPEHVAHGAAGSACASKGFGRNATGTWGPRAVAPRRRSARAGARPARRAATRARDAPTARSSRGIGGKPSTTTSGARSRTAPGPDDATATTSCSVPSTMRSVSRTLAEASTTRILAMLTRPRNDRDERPGHHVARSAPARARADAAATTPPPPPHASRHIHGFSEWMYDFVRA